MSTTWVLDAAGPAVWQPFIPLSEPRGAHAAATDGVRIWIFGGVGAAGLASPAYELDTRAPAWQRIADFPSPRDHLAGAFLDGKVYALGGRRQSLGTNSARIDVYEPAAKSWRRLPDAPTARGGIAAATYAARVFVFGGEAPGGVTFSETEAYDPAANTWSTLAPMPTKRHGLGAAVAHDGVHVVAGGPAPGATFSGAHERLRATGS